MLFKYHRKSSPLNSTHYAVLYPQNDDRIVAIDSVTSFHPVNTWHDTLVQYWCLTLSTTKRTAEASCSSDASCCQIIFAESASHPP